MGRRFTLSYISTLLFATAALGAPYSGLDEYVRDLKTVSTTENSSTLSQTRERVVETFQHIQSDPHAFSWLTDPGSKTKIDTQLRSLLSSESNPLAFDEALSNSGLLDLYTEVAGEGSYRTILASARTSVRLNEKDTQDFIQLINDKTPTPLAFNEKAVIKTAKEAGAEKLYSGFPKTDAAVVFRQGFRDGVGYGAPGSFQMNRGIFTTQQFSASADWGVIKAKNKTATLPEPLKSNTSIEPLILSMELKPEARILDARNPRDLAIPIQILKNYPTYTNDPTRETVKTWNLAARESFEKYAQLRKRFPQIPDWIWARPEEALSVLLRADAFNSIIYLDAGLAAGTEYVIRNREAIRASSYSDVNQARVELSRTARQVQAEARDKVLSRFKQLIAQEKGIEALELLKGASKAYRGSLSPAYLEALLISVPSNLRHTLIKRLLQEKQWDLLEDFCSPRLFHDPELIKDAEYRKLLRAFYTLKVDSPLFPNTENIDELKVVQHRVNRSFEQYVDTLIQHNGLQELLDADTGRRVTPRALDRILSYPEQEAAGIINRLDLGPYVKSIPDYDRTRVSQRYRNPETFLRLILNRSSGSCITSQFGAILSGNTR